MYMEGNRKIGLTAEAVAALRADKGMPYNDYFATSRGRNLIRLASLLMPKGILDERIELSRAFEQILNEYDPEQVVELASGGSALGLQWATKHPDRVYVESDMSDVAQRKKEILKDIRTAEGLPNYGNHFVESVDVLADDIYRVIGKHLASGKKTLVIAEALTPFFDSSQHDRLVDNISNLLGNVNGGSYVSHDLDPEGFRNITSGLGGKLLMWYVQKRIGNRVHSHFRNPEEAKRYFLERGFPDFKTLREVLGEEGIKRYERLGREKPIMPVYMVSK